MECVHGLFSNSSLNGLRTYELKYPSAGIFLCEMQQSVRKELI
jgi:hypothetical protein